MRMISWYASTSLLRMAMVSSRAMDARSTAIITSCRLSACPAARRQIASSAADCNALTWASPCWSMEAKLDKAALPLTSRGNSSWGCTPAPSTRNRIHPFGWSERPCSSTGPIPASGPADVKSAHRHVLGRVESRHVCLVGPAGSYQIHHFPDDVDVGHRHVPVSVGVGMVRMVDKSRGARIVVDADHAHARPGEPAWPAGNPGFAGGEHRHLAPVRPAVRG